MLREKKTAAGNRRDKRAGRFRLVRLEERIAPARGWNNPKNPHYTNTCGTAGCTAY